MRLPMTHTADELRKVKALDYQQATGDECRSCGMREAHYNTNDCTRSLAEVVTMMARAVVPERGSAAIASLRSCIAELDSRIAGKATHSGARVLLSCGHRIIRPELTSKWEHCPTCQAYRRLS